MASDVLRSLTFRRDLVQTLRHDGHLHSPSVAEALLAVPREAFVPGVSLDEVYRPGDAIVTKRLDGVSVSSCSAPEVIALMLEQLDVRSGQRVLEIGAGTGYNAALLAHLVGNEGRVVSLEIDEDLVQSAREHLGAAGMGRVTVAQADGALGFPLPDGQPYDRIILTVASNDIAPAWREQLARPHGRLVMPLALRGLQRCVAFAQAGDGDCLVSRSLCNCSFISLRGLLGVSPPRLPLDAEACCVLGAADESPPLRAEQLAELLSGRARLWPTGVSVTLEELRQGLHLWLVTHQPNLYTLWGGSRLSDLFRFNERTGLRGTLCLIDMAGPTLALLAWADGSADAAELCVLTFCGPEANGAPSGELPGQHLVDQVRALLQVWSNAGRPSDADLMIHAYPRPGGPAPSHDEVALDRRWTRFLLRWANPYPPAILTV